MIEIVLYFFMCKDTHKKRLSAYIIRFNYSYVFSLE